MWLDFAKQFESFFYCSDGFKIDIYVKMLHSSIDELVNLQNFDVLLTTALSRN